MSIIETLTAEVERLTAEHDRAKAHIEHVGEQIRAAYVPGTCTIADPAEASRLEVARLDAHMREQYTAGAVDTAIRLLERANKLGGAS